MTHESKVPSDKLEAHYTSLFEALPGSCILLKNDAPVYTIIAATPEYVVQTGVSKDDLIGKGMFQAFPTNLGDPTDTGTNDVGASFEHVRRYKEPHHLPVQRYDVIGEDGSFSERYWKAVNKPVFSPDGEIIYIIHTAENITATVTAAKLKEQMREVEESEQNLRSLVLHAPIGICVLDASTQVIQIANDSFVEIAGRPLNEIVGYNYWDIFNEARPYYQEALVKVAREGITYHADEVEMPLTRHGKKEFLYVTFVYEPLKDGSDVVTKVVVWVLDNTPQVAARRKIEESEQRFRLMADSISEIIWVTDAQGNAEFMNKRWEEYTGLPFKPLHAADVAASVVHEDDVPGLMAAFEVSLKTGKVMEVEQRNRSASGEYRWFLNRATPYYDPKTGEVLKWFGSSIDIHEFKIAQQALVESEERFRSMADASPVMIWTLDEDGNSTYYNSRAAEFTGHSETDLREGKSWQVAIHPDDIQFANGVVSNAVMHRIPYQMECRMQRADGEWRWLLNHGIPRFGSDGKYFGFVGSSIDITEQKRNQQQLQDALEQVRLSKEAAELGTFDMDLEKGNLHWDDRCRILFGISHHEAVTYEKDFVQGLHPDDRERILNVINNLFIRSLSNGDYDVEYRTVGAEDGVVRWIRAKGKVYFNENDQPVRFIGSVLDITEKVTAIQKIERLVEERTKELAQANDSLLFANKELQRSNANLEEFAHAASHDLKEPIRKIHFFTSQLKQQLRNHVSESEMTSINRIENATMRMGNLIDDLLLYSHVSQRPHETETVDLNETVQQALEDLDLDIEAKGAIVSVGKLPQVKGYKRQLQQLFQNLISNAVKYSKETEPPRIDITAEEANHVGQRYHLIRVADNGIGFQQEYEAKIFQMFARLHGKGKYGGTGVGLSIVKKVVENHTGFIQVKSELGQGSTFEIYLPV